MTPDNAPLKDVTWASSDEDVATVDENGKATAVSNGKAVITATAKSPYHAAAYKLVRTHFHAVHDVGCACEMLAIYKFFQ